MLSYNIFYDNGTEEHCMQHDRSPEPGGSVLLLPQKRQFVTVINCYGKELLL